jgi:hypothetical protein
VFLATPLLIVWSAQSRVLPVSGSQISRTSHHLRCYMVTVFSNHCLALPHAAYFSIE